MDVRYDAASITTTFATRGRCRLTSLCQNLVRTLCRLACAIPFAAMVATVAGPGSAFAANCTAVQTSFAARAECQIADQETLLGYFNTLPSLTGGAALVTANLQTEENIYLNSTQQQKIASGTVFIVQGQTLQANILLRAFPGNPNYFYNSAGLPTALCSRRPSPTRCRR